MVDAKDFVHEYVDGNGQHWWIVAQQRDGRYYAPMKPQYCRLTGCSSVFGDLSYVAGNAYCYRNRRDALRRVRQLYGVA